MKAAWLMGLLFALLHAPASSAETAAPSSPVSLGDLFSEEGVASASVSPSGRYIAAVVRHFDHDLVVVLDTANGSSKGLTKIGRREVGERYESRITLVQWKSEERLLFRVEVGKAKTVSQARLTGADRRRLGHRLFAIDRDGKNQVRMLEKNRQYELDEAWFLGDVRSLLVHDPDHILMMVDGEDGRSLFKVNVHSGVGKVVEHADEDVWDWWLDLEGRPVVRVTVSQGFMRFYRRNARAEWKLFQQVRVRELLGHTEYEPLGPSDQPGKYYVLARPDNVQRRGVYLYDLEHEEFGAPLAENAEYDIDTAFISRDGKRVQRYCYFAHIRICETADPTLNTHLKSVRHFFKDSVNVYFAGSAEDNQTLLMEVDGPSDAPAFYWYRLDKRQIQRVGLQRDAMANKRLPTATVVNYTARDGMKLHGYLTRPAGAARASQLPLVMLPHGGPEERDSLAYHVWVQYLASLGYAVFQPNFRGSDGFGRNYIEAGFGQWGRKMQDDIGDALALLVDQKVADPGRVCIFGASYGGYAALTGATLTPDLYKCVVSIAGVSDLDEMLKMERRIVGKDSAVYAYWVKQIGDPDRDAEGIAAISPITHTDRVKAPILLVHGDDDDIVPYEQSVAMKRALERSGRPTQLITLEDEGHSGWSDENQAAVLSAIGQFLRANIGPGFKPGVESGR